jgi:hypothetical protein
MPLEYLSFELSEKYDSYFFPPDLKSKHVVGKEGKNKGRKIVLDCRYFLVHIYKTLWLTCNQLE